MMTGLSPHVFAVAIERDLFVFDSGRDRYLALSGAVASSSPDGIDVGLHGPLLLPDAAAALMAAGLLASVAERGSDQPIERPTVMRDASFPSRRRACPADAVRFVFAMTMSGWDLKQGRSCRTFSAIRQPGKGAGSGDLSEALLRLRETRLIVPSPRRCLPASLIAARFLQRLGHPTEIVFGVRSHPFAAHCWIEADGEVLDDDIDRVRAFTPIAVGLL